MSEDFKQYDTQHTLIIHNARLTADPKVWDNDNGKTAQVKFVLSSRNEKHKPIWVTASIGGKDGELASYLKKGDVLGFDGFLVNKPWGDDGEKDSFELIFARMHAPVSLFMTLKERGFAPGAKGAPAAKGKAPAKGAKKRPVVDIPDDED